MTEQSVNQQAPQEDVRRSNRGAAKHLERDYHSDVENADERQAADLEQQEQTSRRKPVLIRSKTFNQSMLLAQVQTDSEPKIGRKKSQHSQLSKTNCQYHKIFKEISKEEQLRQSYTCALQKDILYQGRMFVSDHWICFHSKVFGKDTKIAIPVVSVTHIKKTKTAILVPNALVIATANDRVRGKEWNFQWFSDIEHKEYRETGQNLCVLCLQYVFVSLLSRDNTYKVLMSVCLHLEEKSPCSSPAPSPAEHSFRGQRSPLSPRFPLNFPGDFSDLDGALRQRRQGMEESSSSDSQTHDYDKVSEFPVSPYLDALKRTHSKAAPEHLELQHKVKNQPHNKQSSDNKQRNTHNTGSEGVIASSSLKPVSITSLLVVYLFLVCILVLSSCYLAIKIVTLEQKLTAIGTIQEFTHQG
ncbi:GRAM domain-containing protein 2B isoform X3 [Nelusetta ayraudi]